MENSKSQKFDLGSKNVKKTFFSILIPTMIAQLIAGTFVIFDTYFVSNGFQASSIFNSGSVDFSNSYASLGPAAISYAMPYTFFIIGVGLAIGAGLSAIMTKQIAKGDEIGIQKSMNSYMPLSIFFGILLMIFLLLFAKVLVWFGSGFQSDYLKSWFNNPLTNPNWSVDPNSSTYDRETYNMINGHILSQAAWYLRIQALGAIPYIYMSAGIIMLRVQGKAKYATSFSAVGLIVNIILDYTFIIVLKTNIVGAAIATVIGQYATASVYMYYFKYKADVKANKLDWTNAKESTKEVAISGISIMMLQVLTGIILIMFTFSIGITNYNDMSLVTNYTSVYQGYNAVFIFANLMIIAVAQSMKPIVEFNYIKGDVENVKKARNLGYSVGLFFSLTITIFIVIFSQNIIGLFYSVDGTEIDLITSGQYGMAIYTNGMDVASKITMILFISFPIATLIQLTGTYIQAMGEDKKTSILLFGKLILLFPLILLFGFVFSGVIQGDWITEGLSNREHKTDLGMFLSLPITDFIIGSLAIYYLFEVEKNTIKTMKGKIII